jgi:hypothetical protein
MKGKFKLLGHIGLALFLVSVMVLALAPVAQAATAVTKVWVEFDDNNNRNTVSDSGNEYIIHFKPTTALVRGADWVTVTFPDGTSTMGGAGTTYAFSISGTVAAADLEFSTDYGTTVIGDATWKRSTSNAITGGYRVKVKCPFNYAAGTDVWLKISSTSITSAATAGDSYKVYVSTTKDTTPVLSSAFSLGDDSTVVSSVGTSLAPATAGATGQYIINFTPGTALTQSSGTVTVRFPVGTVLPSSMSASDIEFEEYGGSSYTACGVTPTVDTDRRLVTATTPVTLGTGGANYIKFKSSAGIINPTIADDSGDYYCAVRTSGDREWVIADADHDVTAGSASKIAIANGEIGKPTSVYSDNATMVNMLSSYIYVYVADQYGNAVDTSSSPVTVGLTSSSSTGTFYTNSNATPGSGTYSSATTATVDAQNPADAGQQLYYKDTAAGTYTLTFSDNGGTYTSATWTMTVAPAVSLYDANSTLVNTYGALSTSPVAEIAAASGTGSTQKYASDYINSAITAAMTGDTVKLGDGIYEMDNDSSIALSKLITLTSVNGASHTTLRPTEDVDKAITVTGDGTSTNPVIISGLTFQWLRYQTDIECAIYNNGYDYMTVQNCVFNNIEPDQQTQDEGVVWVRTGAGAITSLTISNNTFSSCVTTWPDFSGSKGSNISASTSSGSGALSGVTISGNTLTNCYGYGITVGGSSGYTVSGTISNNTVTNGYSSLNVSDYVGTSGLSITGNTVTNAYGNALKVEGAHNGPITIKTNTFTGSCDETRGAIRIEHEPSGGDGTYTHYVQYNNIYDNNSPYAIYIDSGDTIALTDIDCRYNWYGDATGPAYTALTGATVTKSNPNGAGDAVTDRVFYYPWLHKPIADVIAENASYQASTIKLVAGWNTLSTPVKLISTADAINELIPSGMTIGYYYSGGWQQITTGYVLNPCDAVYVKMSAVTYVLLKFDASAFSTPSKSLAAGWNLIGLASLSSSGMKDAPAVASVYSTAAGLPGYSQVISPSLNAAQTGMYGNAGTSWTYSRDETTGAGTNYMYAGLGYWVYMQNAATLAGFEITPIVPDLD